MTRSLVFLITSLMLLNIDVFAQCAMCKTTIVNNVSHGELALAEGLNFGIMYLFATPYLVIVTIVAVWVYKKKKYVKKSR